MKFYEENIPYELKKRKQWVCYRKRLIEGKINKLMINPFDRSLAKSNDPSTWSTFFTASKILKNPRNYLDGLAFVLTEGYVFIDIDHSIDEEGHYSDFAKKILRMVPDTYAERSCSGHGLHIIAKGKMIENAKKRNDALGIEMYETKRFLCMTGDVIDERRKILDKQEELEKVSKEIVGLRQSTINIVRMTTPTMSDEKIIEKIRKSKQGDKFESLYMGQIEPYHSASNADYALARLLGFWTQDKEQIKSIMRSSGLYRDKYERPLGDSTYLDVTVDHALSMFQRHYAGESEM